MNANESNALIGYKGVVPTISPCITCNSLVCCRHPYRLVTQQLLFHIVLNTIPNGPTRYSSIKAYAPTCALSITLVLDEVKDISYGYLSK